MVVLWLGCSPFSSFPYLPKICSLGPSSGFPMYLPNFPSPVIGSSHSTLIALNNVNHKFWNFSKTAVSDVSGLLKKTKLPAGVPLAPSAYLPSIAAFLRHFRNWVSSCKGDIFFGQDIWMWLNWGLTQLFLAIGCCPDWWILLRKKRAERKIGFKKQEGWCSGVHIVPLFWDSEKYCFLCKSTSFTLEIALK